MQLFTAGQTAFDPLLTLGAYDYWKSQNFLELRDGLLDSPAECEIPGAPPVGEAAVRRAG